MKKKLFLKIEKRFGLLEAFFADGHVVELLVSRVHYDAKRIVPFLQVGESGYVARKSAGFIAILFPTFRHVGAIAKLQAQRVWALAGRVVYQVYGNRRIFVMRVKVVSNCCERGEIEITAVRSVRVGKKKFSSTLQLSGCVMPRLSASALLMGWMTL